jgi:hypothetical protein
VGVTGEIRGPDASFFYIFYSGVQGWAGYGDSCRYLLAVSGTKISLRFAVRGMQTGVTTCLCPSATTHVQSHNQIIGMCFSSKLAANYSVVRRKSSCQIVCYSMIVCVLCSVYLYIRIVSIRIFILL